MDELIEVCSGKKFRVMMTTSVAKQFGKVDAKERARCQKWMKFFADEGFDLLDDQKLKHEGKFSSGHKSGTKVPIWAFKAWQLRVYGSLVGGNVFVATEIDPRKQQNAADQGKLEAAAKKIVPFLEIK